MNRKEAYAQGYARGMNGASWIDMPSIGAVLSPNVDWQGIGAIESVEDMLDAWEALCAESEANDRCYSPFEFTAHEINESEDSETLWERFDAGIEAGRNAYRRKHYKLRELRKEAKRQLRALAE